MELKDILTPSLLNLKSFIKVLYVIFQMSWKKQLLTTSILEYYAKVCLQLNCCGFLNVIFKFEISHSDRRESI